MQLSRNQETQPIPYPMQTATSLLRDVKTAPSQRVVAELMDLVAAQRPDLWMTFVKVLEESESTRGHAMELLALIDDCGVSEAARPCATALSIAADLERLAHASDGWSHPSQILRKPDAEALHKLCAARVGRPGDPDREALLGIRPRLERAARLALKAASRRGQSRH